MFSHRALGLMAGIALSLLLPISAAHPQRNRDDDRIDHCRQHDASWIKRLNNGEDS